jgi:hypothetical protein
MDHRESTRKNVERCFRVCKLWNMANIADVYQYCQPLLFYVASGNFSLQFLLLCPSLCKNLMHA